MKKFFFIILSVFFLTSCSDNIYFKNCVKDARAVLGVSEGKAATYCEQRKKRYPDKFKYLKGKVFSSE